MMRPTRANKPDGYLLGSYRIATAQSISLRISTNGASQFNLNRFCARLTQTHSAGSYGGATSHEAALSAAGAIGES